MNIPFFKSTVTGREAKYIHEVLRAENSLQEKKFVRHCENWFVENHGCKNFFLTKSCSNALELSAQILGIEAGDEIILPSYAFVSCANAFVNRGAKCVFVDIEPNTMNIDETKIEAAITSKTKAIVTLNYAGVGCNYEKIKTIADAHKLFIVEDNAHGTGAKYNEKFLGTFGDISTFSFDQLKNITCGQGGGISINNENLLEKFYVPYEFGTNRRVFFQGRTDRYEWIGIGSNHILSELNAAMLYAQLEEVEKINARFVHLGNSYRNYLDNLCSSGEIYFSVLPSMAEHNGHCFFIKTKSSEVRNSLIAYLHEKNINAQFHYTPLHSSVFGRKSGTFSGEDIYTTVESSRLLRLPVYCYMTEEEVKEVSDALFNFYY